MKLFFPARIFILMLFTFSYLPVNAQKKSVYLDYGLHYLVSTEISFAGCMFCTLKNPKMSLAKKYAISSGIGVFVGVGKEIIDLVDPEGDFDWLDIGFDVIGTGSGLLLHYFVFDKKLQRTRISLSVSEEYYLVSFAYRF